MTTWNLIIRELGLLRNLGKNIVGSPGEVTVVFLQRPLCLFQWLNVHVLVVKAQAKPLSTVWTSALEGAASLYKVTIISVVCAVLLENQANRAQPESVTKVSPLHDVQFRDEAARFRLYAKLVIFIFI